MTKDDYSPCSYQSLGIQQNQLILQDKGGISLDSDRMVSLVLSIVGKVRSKQQSAKLLPSMHVQVSTQTIDIVPTS